MLPIDQLLNESADDVDLCAGVFELILKQHGSALDASTLPEAQRIVVLSHHARGIIDNAGFEHLFEGRVTGDADFALTAQSFATIGCTGAVEAFEEVFALFSDKKPPADLVERLDQFGAIPEEERERIDIKFRRGTDDFEKLLARYIRGQRDGFVDIGAERAAEREVEEEGPHPIELLPHWARVAFAARCARRALPFFEQHAQAVNEQQRTALARAVELAERSAEKGAAAHGLEEAARAVLDEMNDFSSRALAVAESASQAVRTAQADTSKSATPAREAFRLALEAVDEEAEEAMRRDLARLQVAAGRERWKEGKTVGPDLIDRLPDPDPPQVEGLQIIDVGICIVAGVALLAVGPNLPAPLPALTGIQAVFVTVVGILIGAQHRLAPPLYLGVWLSFLGLGLGLLIVEGFGLGGAVLVFGSVWGMYFNYPDVRDAIARNE